jgi:hypothetical protein
MCEVSADINMSRHQKQPPSLEDALAKGFSELKIGEANLPEATPPAPYRRKSTSASRAAPHRVQQKIRSC